MTTEAWSHKMHYVLRLSILVALSCVVGWQIGNAQVDNMKKGDFQV